LTDGYDVPMRSPLICGVCLPICNREQTFKHAPHLMESVRGESVSQVDSYVQSQ